LVSIGGGSYACSQINATQGVINGTGIVNYIPAFTGVSTISASPFYLTSNNLNLGQQSLINASWVNVSYLNVSAGFVVLPNGNVGIGTINPDATLTIGSGNNIRFIADSEPKFNLTNLAGGGSSQFNRWTNRLELVTKDAFSITNSVDGIPVLWANVTSGNVGIGTAAPAAKLHVVGDIISTGWVNATRFNATVYCLNPACTSNITNNGTHSIWR
jgi:hypothetical protein